MKNGRPIGVFDSGMGGLTVLRELVNHLPNESYIYLGDTARLPYGTKSPETVSRYATQMASILITQNIKLLVVACNTASTAALPQLQQQFPHIPIIGVVEPGARAAVVATKNNKVALLATETTIQSGIYQNTLRALSPQIEITTQTCGLFVALAEEGCTNDEIALLVAKKYLEPIINGYHQCDSVILGCTHFPVLMEPLAAILGDQINIINSAKATATEVQSILQKNNPTPLDHPPTLSFLVTDSPERFTRIGEIFFGRGIDAKKVHLIDGQYSQSFKTPK
ncbi:glutamate racemase [Coxiella burnetii]|uniref:glutamate racemase n=1 Tax=Coxiella burnetii TaxID=777 RepID=UPI000183D016|nr:glutamate racemase [Coxiella burnetii]ACJ18984.1 glutamate racemase [Coxiella burnetii CbuG_Q212]ATN67343.1 glutamate racemase [Coxiella burnetii]OYK85528.1 glutamate racemase [Coxiella burnetii]